jgi:hypothetical protein
MTDNELPRCESPRMLAGIFSVTAIDWERSLAHAPVEIRHTTRSSSVPDSEVLPAPLHVRGRA